MSLCTMFAFEGVEDPNLLHCTHKYFGDDYLGGRAQIVAALKSHFAKEPFRPFRCTFDQLEHFGEARDYRVLLSKDRDPFMLDLKSKLDAIHPDSFSEYIPHVTVGRNTDALDIKARDYVLLDNHKVVWSAVGHRDSLLDKYRREFTNPGHTMQDFIQKLSS